MGWAAAARLQSSDTTTRPARDWRLPATVFVLVMMTEPGIGAVLRGLGLSDQTPWARLVWLPVYAAALPLIASDGRGVLRAMRATPLLAALLALALLSALWSIAPGVTLRRAAALGMTMAFAWRLAWMPWRDLTDALARTFSVLVIASYGLALLWPAAGIMGPDSTHPGAWSGVWTHKNMLGGTMAVGAVFLVASAVTDAAHRRRWSAMALGAAGLVLLSTSATALLVLMLGLGALAFAGALRAGGPAMIAAFGALGVGGVAAVTIAALGPDVIFTALGRDPTLTGRTDIWSAVVADIGSRPLLGYGFGAFWHDPEGPAFWVRQALHWDVPNAHNGWLELLLALGGLGVALFAAGFARTVLRALTGLASAGSGSVAFAFLAMFLPLSLAEGYILQDNSLLWLLYTALAAGLALKSSGKESV